MSGRVRTAREIRRAYRDFFVQRGHTEVPSAPLVPQGDPTLLFTSAGMVQFKDFYLTPDNLPYKRAVSVQKCLRAGDIESVGRTLRHHTFFEMLGNFSFGDYFKLEAIEWAWEFVTRVLQLPPRRLSVSIFEEDDEAFEVWNGHIGVAADRIVRLGRRDNFWGPVGKSGVCGPCSEIYYDMGARRGCGGADCAPGCDCDRFIEFWNLVFPQFFREEDGRYRPLERPGIDTGAGLERIAVIMQGVEDNYHTDLFSPIVEAVYAVLPPGAGRGGDDRMGVNMIADHIRALTFAVSEGIYPSNEGRGYLLRRILRRALTRLHAFGVKRPVMHAMVETVAEVMGDDYPELVERSPDTAMIIRCEEDSFFRTLGEGRERFRAMAAEIRREGGDRFDGRRVFLLYDTYGFPLELTRALAGAEGLAIDEEGFEQAMREQRLRAQECSAFDAACRSPVEMVTLSTGENSIFTGYESVGGEAEVRRYRIFERTERADLDWTDTAGTALELVLDRTPFYAAAGGQIADRGSVEIGGRRHEIRDVFNRGGEIVHVVETAGETQRIEAALKSCRPVRLRVDDEARLATAANHTATHLLQAALREVVGKHVSQAGSLVEPRRLRFDFNHYGAVSPAQFRRIEELVNGWVRAALDVTVRLMDRREALGAGAVALFGEKYGERVRVVAIGDVSIELCGGTHLSTTGQIGLFLIVSESGVAAGVRRIEAVTGAAALAQVHEALDRIEEAAALLKVPPAQTAERIRSLLEAGEEMKREIRRLERGGSGGLLDAVLDGAVDVAGATVATGRLVVRDVDALRGAADLFRGKVRSGAAVFSLPLKGKMHYVITVTDDLAGRGIGADGLARELAALAGGGGGGKKHIAQLGTKDLGSEQLVFEALPGILRRLLT